MVVYCTLTYKNTFPSPLEEIKNEEEMNILLWAAMFHDIAKTEKYDTPDRSHPFLSAALTLQIFHSMGFITSNVDEAVEMIKSSCVKISSKSYWKRYKKEGVLNPAPNEHDHSKLHQIYECLWSLYPKDSFIDQVINHIMFH